MTQATTTTDTHAAAWPIDTPGRILNALAGKDGATAREVSETSGVALQIVLEWLTSKVRQGLLRFDERRGTYCTLCRWPGVATVVSGR